MDVKWANAVEKAKQVSFRIETPQGSGTGFLATYRDSSDLCGVATAYHVIGHSHEWEEPIKLTHSATGEQVLLRQADRFIFADSARDTALIIFSKGDLKFKTETLTLAPKDKSLKVGMMLGWAGYPMVAPTDFCFFSGCVSCYLNSEQACLVDGVAINGVSGGPAFTVLGKDSIYLIGVVSAYIPNRATGESLPGVCVVVGISPFYKFMKVINSTEDAREKANQVESGQPAGEE